MTHTSSRKQFFARLLGLAGATSVLSTVFAKTASPASGAGVTVSKSSVNTLELRHDARAVARRDAI